MKSFLRKCFETRHLCADLLTNESLITFGGPVDIAHV